MKVAATLATVLLCVTTTVAASSYAMGVAVGMAISSAAHSNGGGGSLDIPGPSTRRISCRAPTGPLATNASQQAPLQECVIEYQNQHDWSGMKCGGKGFFRGGLTYSNPVNFYGALEQSLNNLTEYESAQCDNKVEAVDCWMGFH